MSDQPTRRRYYAATYPYGVASDANTGNLIRNFVSFPSAAERDAWVADAPTDYRGNAGYREVITSDNAQLRRALRDGYIVEHEDELLRQLFT